MERIKINSKHCFIIAEAGINHNGSLKLAKKLVDAAKKAGADAVKFQTYKGEDLVTRNAGTADYHKKNTGRKQTQLEMIKKFELGERCFLILKRYCDEKGIIFLSTPHTEPAADLLEPLVPLYKIGSGDLNNLPFLEKIAKRRKLIILSTGMSLLKEIKEAVRVIKKSGNNKIILLHCTTNYPCPMREVNLKAMLTIKKETGLPVGYSDHTVGIQVPIAAVALGACVLEKHFTLDKNLSGPDHKASLDPDEFQKMVRAIRAVEKALGDGIKKLAESEKQIKKIARKSIVAKTDIKKGEIIKKEMLVVKRPGIGIEPKYFSKVVGRKAKINIKKDKLITWKMIL